MVAAAGLAKASVLIFFLILFLITLISGLVNRNKVLRKLAGKRQGHRLSGCLYSIVLRHFWQIPATPEFNAVAPSRSVEAHRQTRAQGERRTAARHRITSDPEAMILDRFDILLLAIGAQKLGQPVPESNFRFRTE